MASFPYARRIISRVSAPDLPSFTQDLMFALCSSFHVRAEIANVKAHLVTNTHVVQLPMFTQ